MKINTEHFDKDIVKINLSGRMDLLGTQEIDMKFTALTATQKGYFVIDLSEVSFLASLGMRTLISSAKAVSMRGGLMVLANPQPNVKEVLDASGVSSLIPVYHELQEAISIMASHQEK
jgi:anti-sigma B factor antagonist